MNSLLKDHYFARLPKDKLPSLLCFYLREIYEHFGFTEHTDRFFEHELLNLLCEDDRFYKHSIYQVLKGRRDDKIYGSVKITYWNRRTPLPIEKLFKMDLENTPLPESRHIWHIGRFVIAGSLRENRIGILKKMLYNAFYPVTAFGNGLVIAECDSKLVDTLRKMGIEVRVLGEPVEYICSETLPIYIKSDWLETFMAGAAARYHCADNLKDKDIFREIITKLIEEHRGLHPLYESKVQRSSKGFGDIFNL